MIENIPYVYLHKVSNGQFKISLKLKASNGNSHQISIPEVITGQSYFEINAEEIESGATNLSPWYPSNPSSLDGVTVIVRSLGGEPPWNENTCTLMKEDQTEHENYPNDKYYLPHLYLAEVPKDSNAYDLFIAIDYPTGKSLGNPVVGTVVDGVRKISVEIMALASSTGGTFSYKLTGIERGGAKYLEVIVEEGPQSNRVKKGGGKVRHVLADPKPTPWDER